MQTIQEYIKENKDLCDMLDRKLNRSQEELVIESDLFPYDAIIEEAGEVQKVIYLSEDKTRTWNVADILSYTKEDIEKEYKDDPEELQLRLNAWESYMKLISDSESDALKDLVNNVGKSKLTDKGI